MTASKKPATLNDALASFKEFVRELNRQLNKAPHGEQISDFTGPMVMFENIILTGELAEKFAQLSGRVYEAVMERGYVSKSTAESLLQGSIGAAVKQPKGNSEEFDVRLSEEARKLKDALQEAPSEWECHVPVVGLDPASLPAQFGRVSFYVADETTVKAKAAAAIEGTPWSEGQKEAAKNMLWEAGGRELNGRVVGTVSTMAVDAEAANALAVREVRRTLDVINFFASWRHPSDSKAALPWESYGSATIFLRFQKGGGLPKAVKWELKGAIIPVSLATLQGKPGFGRISKILNKVNPDGFERRLLSAIQWAGRGAVEERRDQCFLFYVISLENLLLGGKRDSEIGYRFRVRGAHLLGSAMEARKRIEKQLRSLYTLRSQIVHSGADQVTDSDLSQIQHFSKGAAWSVLTGDEFASMASEDELESWFDEKILQ